MNSLVDKIMIVLVSAALAVVPAMRCSASQDASVSGVILRAQSIRGGVGDSTRLLLSTDEGLCAVRVPGACEEWESYVDAEVKIAGEMQGIEFVVSSQSDVQVLKYPPTDPDALVDILPAGELVQRRIRRQEAESEARSRSRRMWLYVFAASSTSCVLAVLAYLIMRSRRKANFFRARLATERRRTGRLHENIEQQLSGSRYLLQTALSCSEGTPKEVSETMSTVSDALSDINRKVHRTSSQRKPVEEMRGEI